MKTIAVIFGGRSTEHDISIVTALGRVIKPLELSGKYHVEAVYINKDGKWFWDDKLKDIKLFQTSAIDDFMNSSPDVLLQVGCGLALVKAGKFAGRKSKKIDVVFPAMHGVHGEDGDLMGLLEMAGVPYVGCGVAASAVAMDKILTKQIVMSTGLPTNKWIHFTAKEFNEQPKQVLSKIESLKYPVFVKPAHGGSSIGITRAVDQSQLVNALEVAVHYDSSVIVEEAVPNLIEITLPILGNEEPIPAYVEQPVFKAEDFFDFETKYINGGKGGSKSGSKTGGKSGAQGYSKIPAEIPAKLYQEAESIGLNVYKALGCSGTARVDMLIDSKAGKIYVNEVNPMPGDLYAHNWQRKGVSNVELVQKLVAYAEERFAKREQLQTSFSTNFLRQF